MDGTRMRGACVCVCSDVGRVGKGVRQRRSEDGAFSSGISTAGVRHPILRGVTEPD